MATLSQQILMQIDQEVEEENAADDEQVKNGSEIDVKFKWIPGFRKDSEVVWAYEEHMLYYYNSYSSKTDLIACTCYDPNCHARIYIRKNDTAFLRASTPHDTHASHYQTFLHMHCFNLLKQKANDAPASTRNLDIYNEVIQE